MIENADFLLTTSISEVILIAAERASLKRASEAADLICVCRGEFISKSQTMFTAGHCGHARWEMRRTPFLTCVSSPIMSCVQKTSCFRLAV